MQPSDEPFSDESKKCLLEVKKGKARKFVMIKDGVQINLLAIFKLGTFERVVRTARQGSMRGEAFWGTVRGDGVDIRFELSRHDGFMTPPGAEIRLKEFLREMTSLKFEPTYVIVDNLTKINESESEEDSEAAGSVDDSVSTLPAAGESEEDKFVRLLKSILPHVKQALAIDTSVSGELQHSVRQAQELGRRREFGPAFDALRNVGALTKKALAEAEQAATMAKPNDLSSQLKEANRLRRQEWDSRLAEIEPRFKAATSEPGTSANKLRMIMTYAHNEARQQRFVKALVALDRLERLMDESVAATA